MSYRRTAATSALWSAVLQWSRFGLNTIVFLLLTRLLTLEEIGAFAVAFAGVRVTQVLQRTGFVEAIAQSDRIDDEFLNTMFWIALGFGCLAGLALFGLSYFLDALVGSTTAGRYLAAMSIIPVMLGASVVSEGVLLRRLAIRGLALRSVVSLAAAGVVAVKLGLEGHGGWALAGFALVNMGMASLWAITQARWLPTGFGRAGAAREAAPIIFGVSGRNVANAFVMPVLQIITGSILGPAAAGAFQIAQRFLTLAETVAISPMRYVALPLFARLRDDPERLKRGVLEALGTLSLIATPVYFGLLAVSDNFLPFVVGAENGEPTVPLLQAMLLVGGVVATIAISNQALTVIGRPMIALQRAVLSLGLNVGGALIAAQYSATAVCAAYAAITYITAPLLLWPVLRAFSATPLEAFRRIASPIASATVMVAAVLAVDHFLSQQLALPTLLGVQILTGIAVYCLISAIMSRRTIREGFASLRSLRRGQSS